MNKEYEEAYCEVDFILEHMNQEEIKNIPIGVREFFKRKKAKEYQVKLRADIPINKQLIKKETMAILSLLNRKYLCDKEEI